MKIIDVAICKNNIDPKGFGRIRFSSFNEMTGPKERAFEYEEWEQQDRFVAKPFLPTNINMIPLTGQSVMIICFNTTDDTTNQFYIPGPFVNIHDTKSQKFTKQNTYTTYGMSNVWGDDIVHKQGKNAGEFVDKRAEGSLAKIGDYGVYGRYGSDVIFTENGVNIRGGKLLSKEYATEEERERLIYHPLMAERSANLHLKKFPHILEYTDENVEVLKQATDQLNYLIEYNIRDFDNGNSTVDFYVYSTLSAGSEFQIQNKNLNTLEINSECFLLNRNNVTYKSRGGESDMTPTFSMEVNGNIETYITIRNTISQLHTYGLNKIDPFYNETDIHPFYFRPTKECLSRTGLTELQKTNKNTIFTNITPLQKQTNGLFYSKVLVDPPTFNEQKVQKILKKSDKNQEQTFAALKSDRIFLLSTDTNEYDKVIDFKKLDNYEPTQKNYIQDIEPNTYGTVRGEVLITILKSMMDLFESHQHNLTDPLVKEDPNFIRLQNQINTLENDLLNNSIRIN